MGCTRSRHIGDGCPSSFPLQLPSTNATRSGTLQACPCPDAPTSHMWRRCCIKGPTWNAPSARCIRQRRLTLLRREVDREGGFTSTSHTDPQIVASGMLSSCTTVLIGKSPWTPPSFRWVGDGLCCRTLHTPLFLGGECIVPTVYGRLYS